MSEKLEKVLKSSKPIRMWIDGKCFDIKVCREHPQTSKSSCEPSVLEEKNINNLSSIDKVRFFQNERGLFHIAFKLPEFYYQKLQTQERINISNLSEKTQTKIIIPENGREDKIEILGNNEENLKETLDQIHSIIASIRDKSDFLQFSAIPILSEEIQSNFEKFKKSVLEDGQSDNIDESIIFRKEKLHLTINSFVLLNEREIEEATKVLTDFRKYFLVPLIKETGPLKISVKGIDCMTSNYKKTKVLYARALILGKSGEDILENIADELSQHFYERENGVKAEQLLEIIENNIFELHNVGLNPVAIKGDQSSTNQKYFGISDPPHILKCLRNAKWVLYNQWKFNKF